MHLNLSGHAVHVVAKYDPGDEFIYLSFENPTEWGRNTVGSLLLDPSEARELIAELQRGIDLVESTPKETATT